MGRLEVSALWTANSAELEVTGYVDVMVKPVTEDTVGQWQPGMGTGLGQNGRVGKGKLCWGKYSGT